jgi:branched-chain amino acid transport system substrate-binding protein
MGMRMRTGAVAVASALAMALAACGGDNTSGSPATTTPTTAPTATTATPGAVTTVSGSSTTSAGANGATSGLGSGGDGSGNGKTLQFGAVFSLTGAGGVYGPSQKNGVQLAFDTINANGGVNGAKIAVEFADDGSDKTQAAQATQRLIQEKDADALIGPTLSNSAVAAHPIAANAKVPMLAVSATGLGIVGPDCAYCNGWIFRDSLGEADAIPANITTYVNAAHPKTGVLLYPNDDKFSTDGAAIVKDAAPKAGIQILDSIEFTKAETDLTPYVTRAVQKGPDVIFITSLGAIPPKVMTEARKQGFKGQFLGGNGFNSDAVSKQAGPDGKGAQSASAWYVGNDFAANKDFVTAYTAKFGAAPDQFAAQSYAGVQLLADAAMRAKLTYSDAGKDRQAIRDALETDNVNTPLGAFQFTKDHDVRQTIWIIAMDGQGGFTLVTSVKPS